MGAASVQVPEQVKVVVSIRPQRLRGQLLQICFGLGRTLGPVNSVSILCIGFNMAGRHLATSSSALQMVKPPVAVYGVEGRYATALYSAASKQKALDAVEKDLNAFSAQIQKDKKLQDFLHDPSVNKALKAEGMSSACDKMK